MSTNQQLNPSLAEIVVLALHQLKESETIGRRRTPVISFWPMRKKWEHLGVAWRHRSTDGDVFIDGGNAIVPAIIDLLYIRCANGMICQLAYVKKPEQICDPLNIPKEYRIAYEAARSSWPEKIAA